MDPDLIIQKPTKAHGVSIVVLISKMHTASDFLQRHVRRLTISILLLFGGMHGCSQNENAGIYLRGFSCTYLVQNLVPKEILVFLDQVSSRLVITQGMLWKILVSSLSSWRIYCQQPLAN